MRVRRRGFSLAFDAARLQITVVADTDAAVRGLRSVDTQVQKTGTSFGGLSTAVKGFALGGGLLAAGGVMLDMAQAAAADAASVAQLNQAVQNAEGGLAAHAKAIDRAVSSGQQMAFTDDQTRGALVALTNSTGDADEAFRRLESTQNLARGTGMDLATAAKLLGKVSDENTTALRRYGISVRDGATAQELLNEVDKRFAGQAGTFAETDAAKFARMADSISEAKEAIGAGLLPMMIAMVDHVTTAADSVQVLVDALESLPGGTDSGTASTQAFSTALAVATGGSSVMVQSLSDTAKAYGLFGDDTDDATFSMTEFIRVATGAPEKLNIFQAAMQSVRDGINEYGAAITDLVSIEDAAIEAQLEAQIAARLYTEALGRQAEQAGIANERNTEMALGLELGSGALAEAAFNLSQFAEATETAWAAQDRLIGVWNDATGAMGFWESNLSNAESALELLTGEMEENGGLTAEQQRQYDLLTGAVGRYQGGIEDSEGAVVDAAVAQADFIRIQDELNGKLADGTINQADYNREMGAAAGAIDPAAGASYGLASAQQEVANAVLLAIEKVEGLLVKLGLIPAEKKTEVSTPGIEDAKTDVFLLGEGIGALPPDITIPAYVDIGPAVHALGILQDMTQANSPPKSGPMAFVPDWSWLFEGLVVEAENYGEQAAQRVADFVTGINLDTILGDQADIGLAIANLTALEAALTQIGDTAAASALADEIARLQAESAILAGIVGTDAVQAWLANQNAAQLAAEAAQLALDAQTAAIEAQIAAQERLFASTQAAIVGLAQGGDAAGNFFEGLLADFNAAQAAFDMGLLLGVPPEVLAQLGADLTAAETLMLEGTRALQEALLLGLVDEETLKALAESGGEWFETLYDSIFGQDALDEVSAGWVTVSDVSLEAIAALIPDMEDGGGELIDALVDAISGGAIEAEDAFALLEDASGDAIDAMIEQLQELEDALTVQLAEALLIPGMDTTELNASILAVMELLGLLEEQAGATATAISDAFGQPIEQDDGSASAASSGGGSSSSSGGGGGGGQSHVADLISASVGAAVATAGNPTDAAADKLFDLFFDLKDQFGTTKDVQSLFSSGPWQVMIKKIGDWVEGGDLSTAQIDNYTDAITSMIGSLATAVQEGAQAGTAAGLGYNMPPVSVVS